MAWKKNSHLITALYALILDVVYHILDGVYAGFLISKVFVQPLNGRKKRYGAGSVDYQIRPVTCPAKKWQW